jgi:outer membrane protein assembly factor BamB
MRKGVAKRSPIRYNRESPARLQPASLPREVFAVKSSGPLPCLLSCCVLALCSGRSGRADNWPQWRGPNYDGVSKETRLPTEFSDTRNILWKLPLPGTGSSTPAVWGERIFLTCEDGKDIVLLCASTSGKQLWKRTLAHGTRRRYMRGEGNDASASPSTDGRHVWAYCGTGDLACFDMDGKEVWKFNVQDRYGKFNIWHGMHITPLLAGDRLYLSLLHSGASLVLALDKATGKEVWKVTRSSDAEGECEQAYASPTLWRKGKNAYLVVHGNDYATAHRLSDGKEIWRVGDLNPRGRYNRYLRFVASPVATPELIVVPTAKNGPVVAVKPDAVGLVGSGGKYEQWRLPRSTPDVPSPLVHGGLVYLCGEYGALRCLEAKTGKVLYNRSLYRDRYRASPLYADGKLYLTAHDGIITVVKAGPKFEQLAVNRMDDVITASPVVANGRIYLHGYKALYAIGPDGK